MGKTRNLFIVFLAFILILFLLPRFSFASKFTPEGEAPAGRLTLEPSQWWQKLKELFYQRKIIFRQELPKEWQELKDDIRKIIPLLPGLWDKLKEVLR